MGLFFKSVAAFLFNGECRCISSGEPVQNINTALKICFLDETLVVVDKPAGMLTHRSGIDARERVFLMQTLRNQLEQHVFPVHRLDKPTSGLVLFALNREVARALSNQFEGGEVGKTYQAFVRGHTSGAITIDHPLRDEVDKSGRKIKDGTLRDAVTELRTCRTWRIPKPVDRYPEARYSRVELTPKTGRYRQLRRHMKHISHPILGDVRYGKGTHNRFIEASTGEKRLWLHASELRFQHPVDERTVTIRSEIPDSFKCFEAWLDSSGLEGI